VEIHTTMPVTDIAGSGALFRELEAAGYDGAFTIRPPARTVENGTAGAGRAAACARLSRLHANIKYVVVADYLVQCVVGTT
jgi:hypothetical protein